MKTTVIIFELLLPLSYTETDIITAAAARLKIKTREIEFVKIIRRSLDARPRLPQPSYCLNAVFNLRTAIDFSRVKKVEPYHHDEPITIATKNLATRPIIIGAGPAGLAAAYYLALGGARPLILERGETIEQRQNAVGKFWASGILQNENNVLFGEGGAGAFSDGKLTARSKDTRRKNFVLQMLVEHGASPEILYGADAHLGSDKLTQILPRLRQNIEHNGGEFLFNTRVDDLIIENEKLRGVRVNDGREFLTDHGFCAIGHSADDTYQMLLRNKVALQNKDYAIGVRVELPQAEINRVQWRGFAAQLNAASFFLTQNGKCHSFCMCPGGRVIACSASSERLSTNGMSLSTRGGIFGNAAFLIPQTAPSVNIANAPNDNRVASTLNYFTELENKIFRAGGGDYSLPMTTLSAFPNACRNLPPHSAPRVRSSDFRDFLSPPILSALSENLPLMLKRFDKIAPEEIAIYGAETRSTSPLRILRNENGESVNVGGLFPIGEGAGYAGGIISSAIDGVRAAENI